MPSFLEVLSLIAVGAFWGCTNPLLRQGSTTTSSSSADAARSTGQAQEEDSFTASTLSSLRQFGRIRVWLPYLLNQAGSVLYYFALSTSDLSLAVPICNGLSLVFSLFTSFYVLGERVNDPYRTIVGSALVMAGVALCLTVTTTTTDENEGTEGSLISLPTAEEGAKSDL